MWSSDRIPTKESCMYHDLAKASWLGLMVGRRVMLNLHLLNRVYSHNDCNVTMNIVIIMIITKAV